jgi:hypothetical protein
MDAIPHLAASLARCSRALGVRIGGRLGRQLWVIGYPLFQRGLERRQRLEILAGCAFHQAVTVHESLMHSIDQEPVEMSMAARDDTLELRRGWCADEELAGTARGASRQRDDVGINTAGVLNACSEQGKGDLARFLADGADVLDAIGSELGDRHDLSRNGLVRAEPINGLARRHILEIVEAKAVAIG